MKNDLTEAWEKNNKECNEFNVMEFLQDQQAFLEKHYMPIPDMSNAATKISLLESWKKKCADEKHWSLKDICVGDFLREKQTEINDQIERDRIEYALDVLSGVAIKFEDFSDGWNKIKAESVELRKKLHALGIKPSADSFDTFVKGTQQDVHKAINKQMDKPSGCQGGGG